MARITSITVGLTDSVKVAEYTIIKPHISLTAEVGKDDSYDDVFAQLNEELKARMEAMVDQIKEER